MFLDNFLSTEPASFITESSSCLQNHLLDSRSSSVAAESVSFLQIYVRAFGIGFLISESVSLLRSQGFLYRVSVFVKEAFFSCRVRFFTPVSVALQRTHLHYYEASFKITESGHLLQCQSLHHRMGISTTWSHSSLRSLFFYFRVNFYSNSLIVESGVLSQIHFFSPKSVFFSTMAVPALLILILYYRFTISVAEAVSLPQSQFLHSSSSFFVTESVSLKRRLSLRFRIIFPIAKQNCLLLSQSPPLQKENSKFDCRVSV